MAYQHLLIEKKWQDLWDKDQVFKSKMIQGQPKYYVLDMFPYPSSQGLHVGHPEGYTASDIVARYKRAMGFNVLHPMGWDAFGLPAEQYAIQTGVHPQITTAQAIENFRRQLKSLGFSYDWNREISTCDPKYYKWTQFIFLKLFEKGLAYQKEVAVNWCPALRTVLANEEVVDGKSERGGHPVFRQPMKQWMLKITEYADRLLEDLDQVDWPERTKEAQRNWIGKSEGARIHFTFPLPSSEKKSNLEQGGANLDHIEVFTTRPDTLFGATFLVLAPEHPVVDQITSSAQKQTVSDYKKTSSQKSEVDRQIAKQKTGVFTGGFAVHPLSGKQIPVWIADYVLMDYGTGAIMAVPAHDERDFEFATLYQLPIVAVIDSLGQPLPFTGEGPAIQSEGLWDGLVGKKAISKAIEIVEQKKIGQKQIQYRLRDWLFSRQRYWGEPFPIVQYPSSGLSGVDPAHLPVLLPDVVDYQPSETGESPLARNKDWAVYKNPSNGEVGQRQTDTMPGSAGSSWYFLRYTDPENDGAPFSFDAQKYWMPVDLYIGGSEHTVGHLLYSRFWQKVLFDAGLVSHPEPFKKLIHQGMVLGEDGEKMSKSRGNVINPDIVIQDVGADSLRLYEMFMGPLDKDKPWSTAGLQGVRRFLDRLWRLVQGEGISGGLEDRPSDSTWKLLHKTIDKVTQDIENLSFNTAISQMMILVNEMTKNQERSRQVLEPLCQCLMPFAPHLAEEIWQALGKTGFVSKAPWPKADPSLLTEDTMTIGVQVNGKMRGTIEVTASTTEPQAIAMALQNGTVMNAVIAAKFPGHTSAPDDKGATESLKETIDKSSFKKVIYRPGQILNLIV